MRLVATGLVGGMGLVWGSTLLVPQPGFTTSLVRAMSEAGIVGGLADWFAVTALFRHPLGLPIPHTAIIPANQARLAATLGRFIASNFLTRELVLRKTRELGLGKRVADWLARPQTGPTLTGWVVTSLPALVRALESEQLQSLFSRAVGERIREAEIAPILAGLLQQLAAAREVDALLVQAIDAAGQWIEENKREILTIVEQRSRWWIPKRLNRRLAGAIADGFGELLSELGRPDSEQRPKLVAAVARSIAELASSPERRMQFEALVSTVLGGRDFDACLKSLWRDFSVATLRDLNDPNSLARQGLQSAITSTTAAIAADPAMIARVDASADKIALVIVARRQDVASIVDEVVRSWDPLVMSERLELAVGSDLQFIRINGTLVGAAVGGVLFLLGTLFRGSV